jgi:hypothetical protein
MTRSLDMIRTFLLFALLAGAQAAAAPVYKCNSGGKVSYGDRPCAHGQQEAELAPPAGVSLPGKDAPVNGDARTLLELEKLRIAQEQRAQRAREQQERQALAEQRARQRDSRAASARSKQCARLKLRHKWALDDAARSSHGPKHEAAVRKAKRQAEQLAVECPA